MINTFLAVNVLKLQSQQQTTTANLPKYSTATSDKQETQYNEAPLHQVLTD